MVSFSHEQNLICFQTKLDDIAHEHVVGLRPMKRKKLFASNDNPEYPFDCPPPSTEQAKYCASGSRMLEIKFNNYVIFFASAGKRANRRTLSATKADI